VGAVGSFPAQDPYLKALFPQAKLSEREADNSVASGAEVK
jgi:hypothetical protein